MKATQDLKDYRAPRVMQAWTGHPACQGSVDPRGHLDLQAGAMQAWMWTEALPWLQLDQARQALQAPRVMRAPEAPGVTEGTLDPRATEVTEG